MTNFACIVDGLDGENRVVSKLKMFRRRVRSENGGVIIRFEKGNIENRVKTGKVGKEVKEVG